MHFPGFVIMCAESGHLVTQGTPGAGKPVPTSLPRLGILSCKNRTEKRDPGVHPTTRQKCRLHKLERGPTGFRAPAGSHVTVLLHPSHTGCSWGDGRSYPGLTQPVKEPAPSAGSSRRGGGAANSAGRART